ncbi:nucleoside deaminase [Clostridium sp. MB40-C1]|uniref:nucleoside deaminase n=1 Tax=Clostridium sp. MB40-C1 TaxID=3070996 RepID=UPI0027DFD44D|nr:nucleoside deaminase [Clostridium sp. MB40-C1]WMJ82043.1 nucleoside deaminase [Clostridium sp. MB40-C1]
MNKFMKVAIEEAFCGIRNTDGGPFGAVIVKDGQIITKAHNEVIKTNDPTAHAEIVAIRRASAILGRFDLSDCEIYSSCEPCPMCFAAIHWAKMKKLYYGCTKEDAARIGFDDQYIYDVINGTAKTTQVHKAQIDRNLSLKPFEEWKLKINRIQY